MQLLTATRVRPGDRDGDFSFATEGELVFLGQVCDVDRLNPDEGCGCGRAFIGLHSRRATTVAVVREVDMTEADLRLAVEDHLDHTWFQDGGPNLEAVEGGLPAAVDRAVTELVDLGERWPVGTALARRLEQVTPHPSR